MKPVASLPHLSAAEFHAACTTLVNSFNALPDASKKGKWIDSSLDSDKSMLHVARELPIATTSDQKNAHEDPEIEEDDEERLHCTESNTPIIHYDILLSPSYSVPVLYFYISDTMHRYPPNMDTLYSHIIAPEYVDQTKDVGVLGGITITVRCHCFHSGSHSRHISHYHIYLED
jgi:ubiquitin-like-conjugating enzyme ATG10